MERYGEDNGRFLYEELTRYRQTYRQLTFIETGLEPDGRFEAGARAEAAEKGWTFEKIRGDLEFFEGCCRGAGMRPDTHRPPGPSDCGSSRPGHRSHREDDFMNGKERVLAMLDGHPVDHLPLMPITMMLAADLAGVSYRDYASDHEVLAEAQVAVAQAFGFDHVSAISDPAREVSELGGAVAWFDDQPPAIVESSASWETRRGSKTLKQPDMAAPGRLRDRIEAVLRLRQMTGQTRIVEGWVEGPCAMAADLRGLNTLMLDFQDDPDFVGELLRFAVAIEAAFARGRSKPEPT